MSDEVTKKELQYVQAVLNKKIDDVGKALAAEKTRAVADCQEVDAIVVRVRQDLEAKIRELEKKIGHLARALADSLKRET